MPEELGELVWNCQRQIQTLRDSLQWCLSALVVGPNKASEASQDSTLKFIQDQGLSVTVESGQQPMDALALISSAMSAKASEIGGQKALQAMMHGRASTFGLDQDRGSARSGAGWQKVPSFCITSAFVRLLGAWEQYELDVLKGLYYYRPPARSSGPAAQPEVITPDPSVIYEEPTRNSKDPTQLYYEFPPCWAEVKKKADNNVERHKILKRDFEIEPIMGSTKKKKAESNKTRTKYYEARNAIAHGRRCVDMTLADYVGAEWLVCESIMHVSKQCRDQHSLIV